MVDRITPATTPADARRRRRADRTARTPRRWSPSPTREWVLCGALPGRSPGVGRRPVPASSTTSTRYEQRKLWLLNGGHSLLAYAGSARGHDDHRGGGGRPGLPGLAATQWWDEAAAHLPLPAADLAAYRAALLDRFANARIRHLLAQIAADGSQKLPIRVLPVLRGERAAGRMPTGAAPGPGRLDRPPPRGRRTGQRCWCRSLPGAGRLGAGRARAARPRPGRRRRARRGREQFGTSAALGHPGLADTAGPGHGLVQHGLGEPAGEGVLLAHVVGPEQGHRARRAGGQELGGRPVREPRAAAPARSSRAARPPPGTRPTRTRRARARPAASARAGRAPGRTRARRCPARQGSACWPAARTARVRRSAPRSAAGRRRRARCAPARRARPGAAPRRSSRRSGRR